MSNKATIRKAKQKLLDAMEKLDPASNEYATLAERLSKLTEAEKNQNGWIAQLGGAIGQTAISAIASTINVIGVLRHENKGNIVTTKSLNYAPKPKN